LKLFPDILEKAGLCIAPFEDLAPGDDDKPHLVDILHIPEEAFQQFRMLHLDIDPFYNMHRAYKRLPPISQWMSVINRVESLTDLSLKNNNALDRDWQNSAKALPQFFFQEASFQHYNI
jgi:hypothetical protein